MTTHPVPTAALPAGLGRLVTVVRLLALLGALSLCTVVPAFWLNPEWVRSAGPAAAGLGPVPITLDTRAQWLGVLGSLPGVLLGLWTLWRLWQLFGEYRQGRVFGSLAVQRLRSVARGLLAMALWAPLQRCLMALALTWGNPEGQRMLVLSLGWHDYLGVLSAAVLLAVAAVMAEATRLAEDNAGFV